MSKAYGPKLDRDSVGPKIRDTPYLLGEDTINDFKEKQEFYDNDYEMDKNLFPDGLEHDMSYVWESIFFMRKRARHLCQGTVRKTLIHMLILICNIAK